MRTSIVRLGAHFGKLGKVYGEYRFALSPYEQKAFKGFFTDAIVKVYRRYIRDLWVVYTPPAIMAYLVIDWTKRDLDKFNRKNPADFADDE